MMEDILHQLRLVAFPINYKASQVVLSRISEPSALSPTKGVWNLATLQPPTVGFYYIQPGKDVKLRTWIRLNTWNKQSPSSVTCKPPGLDIIRTCNVRWFGVSFFWVKFTLPTPPRERLNIGRNFKGKACLPPSFKDFSNVGFRECATFWFEWKSLPSWNVP